MLGGCEKKRKCITCMGEVFGLFKKAIRPFEVQSIGSEFEGAVAPFAKSWSLGFRSSICMGD
jgi:hypothetical protein